MKQQARIKSKATSYRSSSSKLLCRIDELSSVNQLCLGSKSQPSLSTNTKGLAARGWIKNQNATLSILVCTGTVKDEIVTTRECSQHHPDLSRLNRFQWQSRAHQPILSSSSLHEAPCSPIPSQREQNHQWL